MELSDGVKEAILLCLRDVLLSHVPDSEEFTEDAEFFEGEVLDCLLMEDLGFDDESLDVLEAELEKIELCFEGDDWRFGTVSELFTACREM